MEGSRKQGKRTHGHGQEGGDCGQGRWVEVEESISGINGNGKNTIKSKKIN